MFEAKLRKEARRIMPCKEGSSPTFFNIFLMGRTLVEIKMQKRTWRESTAYKVLAYLAGSQPTFDFWTPNGLPRILG